MCSNRELALILERVERSVDKTADELVDTRLEVKGLTSTLETWQGTKCSANEASIKELRGKVEKVNDVATSAAFKAAAMYSVGMLAVGGIITWALTEVLA